MAGDFANPPAGLLSPAPDVVVHMWAMTEAQARGFLERMTGVAGRAVVISSCDVYRNYGRLQGLDSGPSDPMPLNEDAPLRVSRYPYRGVQNIPLDGADEYDKIVVENALREQEALPVTILRYPAVYGPNDYHRFRPWLSQMEAGVAELKIGREFAAWRWTHGFCEDVAEAVALAVTEERAAGRTYNVGEADTPTWAERLEEWGRVAGWSGRVAAVAASELLEAVRTHHDYSHHLAIDTSRIRRELGYAEVVAREEGIARTIGWERGMGA